MEKNMEKNVEKQMETVDIKGPPPTYVDDSDVESIVKPERSIFEGKESKPVPAWRNNFFLRTNRRAVASGGVLTVVVILAIALGVLGSFGLIGKHQEHQKHQNGYCAGWEWEAQPARAQVDGRTGYIDAKCTVWIGSGAPLGVTEGRPGPDLTGGNEHCELWVSDIMYTVLNGGVTNPGIDWRCGRWDATGAPATTTTSGHVSIVTPTAYVYMALGTAVFTPSVLQLLLVSLVLCLAALV